MSFWRKEALRWLLKYRESNAYSHWEYYRVSKHLDEHEKKSQ